MYIGLQVKYPLFLLDFNETWIFLKLIFQKYSNIKFHENPSSGSWDVPCRRMDGCTAMPQVIVVFCNCASALKMFRSLQNVIVFILIEVILIFYYLHFVKSLETNINITLSLCKRPRFAVLPLCMLAYTEKLLCYIPTYCVFHHFIH
jgi:hypothetical protein